ncbi:VWA domain-containing protein [Methylophaga nitratireducenticrescens]|uniref:MxaL protein n=1 Tax=Methylophaga nitratireducenticrescens TaxID=754476 RepID=I1XIW9_METNJ|nr:VWA domain-containing protein [Methylophaga nitratireducenticrescens]AFI84338.1 MxaL protein [Methylophaga nitratireducenticrescens]AUZ84412.1 MxaL protein [Methylophaga nitratireducenticrescens]
MSLSYPKRIFLTALVMLISLLMIMAALWLPEVDREIEVMDSLFVIDITDSMNVEDARFGKQTINRLEWAKEYTRQSILSMPCGSHAGLAIFSEARSLILMTPVEVCTNYHDLMQMLSQFHPTMAWARSSEVSKALYTSIRQAKEITPQPTVVFLTDGHEAPPVHEKLFPKFTDTPGEVPGVIVGIGGSDLVPIPKTNEFGEIEGYWEINEVMHKDVYASSRGDAAELNNNRPRTEHLSSQKKSHMETVARRIGFEFISSPKSPQHLIKEMQKISDSRQQPVKYDLFVWLATIALILLVLVFLPYNLFANQHD